MTWQPVLVQGKTAQSCGVDTWSMEMIGGRLIRVMHWRCDAYHRVTYTHMAVTWAPDQA